MAEQGAYAPVEDLFIVPGGIDTSNVGEFKFDKTLEDFKGYDFDYGNISNENLKKFQEELMPVMAPAVAQAQLEGQSYQNALIQAYERSPEVQEIYAKYDISPQRISRNNASEYVYDPFTFGEIQTVDRSADFGDYLKAGTMAGLGLLTGGAISGLGLGALPTAAAQAGMSGALAAGFGGDPVDAALKAGLSSLITTGISPAKEAVTETTTITPTDVAPTEIPSDILTFQADIPDISTSSILEGYTPFSDPLEAAILDPSVSTSFGDPLRAAIVGKGDLSQYGTLEDIANAPSAFTPEIDIASPATLTPIGGLRENLTSEGFSVTGPATSPDIFLERTSDVLPYEYTPSRREVVLSEEPIRPTVQPPQPPSQLPGGGGGASSAAAPSAPATTVTAPAAPSATITPVIQPPTLTSPGSVTNALLTNTLATLASTTAPTTAPQPTVAPPVTPVATTAPTTEPTPVTTTEPTDIFEDTVVDDTTAQIEAEAEAQRQAAEAQAAREAEAARLAEEARKAAEARAAAEAKAEAEKEAIAQAEARADAAEAARKAAEAQAKADAAAAEVRYGEAVAAGEAAGEARYGEGLSTGRGQGAGAGIGAGLGLGLLAGMGSGMGGVGTGFTPKEFEDYEFRKTYVAPELVERTLPLQGYQAPQYSQGDYAQTVADQIRNLTSFRALTQEEVQKSLGLFNDTLLQEAVMQNLYGAGGR
jgi:hypothetical protein